MVTVLTYFGAISGILTSISFALHIFGLDQTKYGKLFCTAANDVVGIYKGIAGARSNDVQK